MGTPLPGVPVVVPGVSCKPGPRRGLSPARDTIHLTPERARRASSAPPAGCRHDLLACMENKPVFFVEHCILQMAEACSPVLETFVNYCIFGAREATIPFLRTFVRNYTFPSALSFLAEILNIYCICIRCTNVIRFQLLTGTPSHTCFPCDQHCPEITMEICLSFVILDFCNIRITNMSSSRRSLRSDGERIHPPRRSNCFSYCFRFAN